MIGHLNFWNAAPGSLNFGANSAGGSQVQFAVVALAVLPTVTFHIEVEADPLSFAVVARMPEPTFVTGYDTRVPRGPWILPHLPWNEGTRQERSTDLTWRDSLKTWKTTALDWRKASPLPSGVRLDWTIPQQQPNGWRLVWGEAQTLTQGWDSISGFPDLLPLLHRVVWGEGQSIIVGIDSISAFPEIVPKSYSLGWEEAERVTQGWGADWGEGLPVTKGWALPWGIGHRPWPGWWYDEPDPPPGIPNNWRLNFACPAPGALNFGHQCFGLAPQWPRVRRSYRVLNSGSLKRLSDNTDIPVTQMTVKLDRDSWGWTLSASLANRSAFNLLVGTWPEVEATINGFTWRFVLDPPQRSRSFGSASYSINGRSLAAHLTDPIHAARNYRELSLKSAEQLAIQELPDSGLWTLDWDASLPTWSIDAGIWQYDQLTPLKAIQRVAESCGAIVQADANDLKLWLKPKWPIKPWDWNAAVADLTLPASYVVSESAQPQVGTNANGVMVWGESESGVVANITIAGTAGEIQRPGVTNPLIVDAYPAATLGIQVLADTWTMTQHQVDLPLQAIPNGSGLITPGLVIDFDESGDGWRGLVISTSISASFGQVQQTLEVIRA